jgi:5,10-methylenetetrahydrofolate reductase
MFDSETFVVTAEIGPPKGIDISDMLENAEMLKGRVHAINITDQQSSVMRLGPIAAARLLKVRDFEPIVQFTCRDRNRIALQSDLLSASIMGVENVLCSTGDHVLLGDHPDAKSVFDLDSVSLLKAASNLMNGRDLSERELKGRPDFCLGCVASPCADPLEPQMLKLEKKTRAGAMFVQTQGVFDPAQFDNFMRLVKPLNIPVIVGVILLKSAGMARFMNKHVAGVSVPEPLIAEMEKATDRVAASVRIAARLINEMKDRCQGVHIMPMGWEKKTPAVLDAAGL